MDKHQLHEFKLVKRRLSAIQRIIKDDLKEGRPPQPKDVIDFVASSEEMNDLCANEWPAAMDAYMDLLEQFQEAASGGSNQHINDRFQKLLESKISCHKAFR